MTLPAARRLVVVAAAGALLGLGAGPGDPPRARAGAPALSSHAAGTPFVGGPRVDDPATLVAWLSRQREADGTPLLVRLPVRVALDSTGVMGTRGWLGLPPASDSLEVRLDDTALGIALVDRVRAYCRGGVPCVLWLEGTWTGRDANDRVFALTRVVGLLAEREKAGFIYAGVAVPGAPAALFDCLNRLGMNVYPENKEAAAADLVKAGTAAIPLLIAALDDERPYQRRDAANRMNLPASASPPPQWVTTPVGARCAELLYRIITPVVDVPGDPKFKVFSEQILSVPDWRRFWAARRTKSLAQIHAELAPLVRAYWANHGTTQVVP